MKICSKWNNIMRNTMEQYGYGNMEQYGAERSKDDYIS